MIWFLERDADLMICEIRQAEDSPTFFFDIAPPNGPAETRAFDSASDLIDTYLRNQSDLRHEGWRPRVSDIAGLE